MAARDKLIEFLNGYALLNEMVEEEGLMMKHKNVIDMDIIEISGPTANGYLNMEITHYLKNRIESDGMTVKFKFKNDTVSAIEGVKMRSAVRNAIYRKDVFNATDNELINLYIENVDEFIKFFSEQILGGKLNELYRG